MDFYDFDFNVTREASFPTALSNSTLLLPILLSLMNNRHTPRTRNTIQNDYDYIIVGGGTAGSVLANRLSEMEDSRILVLEAGDHPPLVTEIPGIGTSLWQSKISWNFKSVPQKHAAFSQEGNLMPYASGKVLGGSSVINSMVYMRGNHKNYFDWEKLGAKGWGYNDVLPYFKKSEDNDDSAYVASGYHGKGGPVSVSRPKYVSELSTPFLTAAQNFGYNVVDSNGAKQIGVVDMQGTIRNGTRCSAAKAYLLPVENRQNLDILLNAYVTKIDIIGNPLTATGVTFDHGGQTFSVKARREVIVSAGAIKTPQLLMISGVGPTNELQKHNITPLVDLPVGMNLMDHASSFLDFVMDPSIATMTEKIKSHDNIQEYINKRSGPLSSLAGISGIIMMKGLDMNSTEDFPNYELYFREVQTNGYKQSVGFKDEVYNPYFKQDIDKPIFSCHSQLLQPKSRGSVTLNSSDPYDMPLIDPNHLYHPQDIEDIVEGLKQCVAFSKTTVFQKMCVSSLDYSFPGCEDYAEDDDRYLRCVVRSAVTTKCHQCCTARMGDINDPASVVDPELRVKFIRSLRVVDGSVMPMIPSGNTAAVVYMIAEKAADIIKNAAQKNSVLHNT